MTITLQGKFVWFELVTRDIKKAQTFYGEVFGWKVTAFDSPDGAYEMITAGDTMIGGYVKPEDKSPAHWTSYLSVTDVEAALQRVADAGGKVLVPPFDVPTIGRMAKIVDPTGASLWLYRGVNDDTEGTERPGTFAWNELITQDPDAAVAFYQKVAGVTDKAMDMGPMGTYHVLHAGEIPRAGIMKAQDPQQPSAWLPYVHVDNADAAVERVTRNGGAVLMPAADIPDVGRFAVFSDPAGAAFAVLQAAPRAA